MYAISETVWELRTKFCFNLVCCSLGVVRDFTWNTSADWLPGLSTQNVLFLHVSLSPCPCVSRVMNDSTKSLHRYFRLLCVETMLLILFWGAAQKTNDSGRYANRRRAKFHVRPTKRHSTPNGHKSRFQWNHISWSIAQLKPASNWTPDPKANWIS